MVATQSFPHSLPLVEAEVVKVEAQEQVLPLQVVQEEGPAIHPILVLILQILLEEAEPLIREMMADQSADHTEVLEVEGQVLQVKAHQR
jgi:hypothetical protein